MPRARAKKRAATWLRPLLIRLADFLPLQLFDTFEGKLAAVG